MLWRCGSRVLVMESSESGTGRVRGAGSFTSENNPKRKRGPEVGDGLTELERCRLIVTQPRTADCNGQQRRLRRLYDRDLEKFHRLFRMLEKAEGERRGLAAGAGVASGVAAGPVGLVGDEGEVAVRELCGRILRRVGRLPAV